MKFLERVTIMALAVSVLVLLAQRSKPAAVQRSPRFAVGFEERLERHKKDLKAETKLAA